MKILRFLILILFLNQLVLAADPQLLSSVRSSLSLPALTLDDKKNILSQAKILLTELYVHRDLKIQTYGSRVDAKNNLDYIEKNLSQYSHQRFYEALSSTFKIQHDLHTKFTLPAPFSCYRSYLPISISEAMGPDQKLRLYVQSISSFSKLRNLIADLIGIQPGDEILEYDNTEINSYLLKSMNFTYGANPSAMRALAIRNLYYINHAHDFLPKKNSIQLLIKKSSGIIKKINLPWIATRKNQCESILRKNKSFHPVARNDMEDIREFYQDLTEDKKNKANNTSFYYAKDPVLKYKIIKQNSQSIGVIILESFNPAKLSIKDFIEDFQMILDRLSKSDFLIIDLRNNGGGYVQIADSLIQFFTPEEALPIIFRLRSNQLTHWYFNLFSPNQTIASFIERAISENKSFTNSLTFHEKKAINQLGQMNFNQPIILTNGHCYSSCDLFTSEMKNQTNAIIVGEDETTGAGGATVINHSQLVSEDYGEEQKFSPLPFSASMSIAWQQILPKDGDLIEQKGVLSDFIIKPNLKEKLSNSDDYYLRVIQKVQPKKISSGVWLENKTFFDFPIGTTASLFLKWKETNAYKAYFKKQLISQDFLEPDQLTGRPVQLRNIKSSSAEIIPVEIIGFNDDQKVWRKIIRLRSIPQSFELTSQHFKWDFENALPPLEIYSTSKMKFNAQNNLNLRTFQTDERTSASLFVEIPRGARFDLKFDYQLEVMGSDEFSVTIRTENGDSVKLLKQSGFVYPRTLSFHLDQFQGEKVEIEFAFESAQFSGAKNIEVDNIELIQH